MRECLKSKTFRFLLVVLIWLFATAAAVMVQAQPRTDSQQQENQLRPTETASSDTSGYAGTDACKTCHDDIYQRWAKTPHWRTTLNTRGGPSKQGCEACHGPGAAHIAGGGDTSKIFVFEKASAQEVNARCLSCHASSTQHANAINSLHARSGVSCISCHSPHGQQTKEFMLIKSQPELCFTCHLSEKPMFNMPFHHRVLEGLIQCTDCHNPHGSDQPKQVRTSASQDAVCFKCHTDKQGPFVYEHEPVKVEGCMACHVPHGGPNMHMLKVSTVNTLCLQCHTTSMVSMAPGAPSFHNQAALHYQACTICHSRIHGSNFDERFFK
jgi:DmsE family decaheme c-type cytochrome